MSQKLGGSWIRVICSVHLVFFIRDAAPERLVLSLKFSPIWTRGVSYLSLILRPILHSLSLISFSLYTVLRAGIMNEVTVTVRKSITYQRPF